ncbi:MAG: ABC transporter ATP-binding protein [Thermoproteus sp.]
MPPVLTVEGLRLYYNTQNGVVKAVDGVSFELERGEVLAIVGESGSGKSSLGYAIMRLLPENTALYGGKVVLHDGGVDLDVTSMDEETLRREVRWRRISMVFQASMNAIDPVSTIGDFIYRILKEHKPEMDKKAGATVIKEALRSVGLPPTVFDMYPFELSGGMKQRVIIALALILRPLVVILDEPTSALDVITQANIISLLKSLRGDVSMILITHDLALASEIADRIAVMYAGKLVEIGSAEDVLTSPRHPYTIALLESTPTLRQEKTLGFIPGRVPSLINPPLGCRFHPRCKYAIEVCSKEDPPEVDLGNGHKASCWLLRR